MRVFNTPLSREVGSRFGKVPQQVCLTGGVNTGLTDLTDQLDVIKTQLDLINEKLQSAPSAPAQTLPFETTAPTKVALYYFNQTADQKLAPGQQINIDSILPVYRIFPASKNLLVDAINELIS